jgi:polysaccharide export outer membrane protein
MIGVVEVAGLTLREAEKKLRKDYIDGGYFVNPQVILVLQEYNKRSVSVLGQVNRPEQIQFPLEAGSMSIVHAITLAGGLTRLARSDAIQVTRIGPDEREQRFTVNVEGYLAGGTKKGDGATTFHLLPGDVVFVPERSF